MENIFTLHEELLCKTYKHGGYTAFKVNDPKPRDIHKAKVRDRLLHHAIYRIMYPYFDRKFIFDSYSCRIDKGTHRAVNRFREFARIVSKNNTRTAWVLKCDIRKFFANIDHQILKEILAHYIGDSDVLWLLNQIIDSFDSGIGVGLPLGNLTSQLLVNNYMNVFDQFAKRELKAKYYIRYADDFIILSENISELDVLLLKISQFLKQELKLQLHPKKVSIQTFASGVDFLGYVIFPDHIILRTKTKQRMMRKIKENYRLYKNGEITQENFKQFLQSYLGILKHCRSHQLKLDIIQLIKNYNEKN